NWTKGTHNIRFGVDLYRQHLNHSQPEFPGAYHGPQGGFTFAGGPTALSGGAAPNQFNSYATFLLGFPTRAGRILQANDEYATRYWARSLYIRDQWQFNRRLTVNYGVRYEMFPMPTRVDRGLERYDVATNKLLICGAGQVPTDCGVPYSKKMFAPRVGFAYRATDTFVIRGGYGITYDPYSLARPLRTNPPEVITLNLDGPNSFTPLGRLAQGIPAIAVPAIGNGIIDIPGTFAVNTLGTDFRRGYIQSWNLTIQKQLRWGFTGQAGYVATRQIGQIGFFDKNTGRIGGGNNSRPLVQQFGRTAGTQFVQGIGNTHYDSLQAMLERRFSQGFTVGSSYTWSKSIGICCTNNSDGAPAIQLPELYHLNRSVSGIHIPHTFRMNAAYDLPFGKGKQWLTSGPAAAITGGWHLTAIFGANSGPPISVTSSNASLNAPGHTQRADQVKDKVEKIGGTGSRASFFDPFAFRSVTDARFGTAGFRSIQGPGGVNLDLGVVREFSLTERMKMQFRVEAFNATNTPKYGDPGTNVSNLQLNPDGSIRNLGGYTEITGTRNIGRDGLNEKVFRFALRLAF
ncbi:MAG: TonB-dependent receptor domain-containing protein, partial [Bryobacteraceae bacterium]